MIINLEKDLEQAISSPTVLDTLERLIRGIVREEIATSPFLDELLDVEKAAEILGLSKSAVHKSVQRGTLPAVRLGRKVRIRRRDLFDGNTGKKNERQR